MFYPRHTPSMVVNHIPSPTVVQCAMAHRPGITGSYGDRHKTPLPGSGRSCTSALGRTAPVGFGALPDLLPHGRPLHLRLFSHLQGVINLDAEVTNCALDLGVPKQ